MGVFDWVQTHLRCQRKLMIAPLNKLSRAGGVAGTCTRISPLTAECPNYLDDYPTHIYNKDRLIKFR
jgi:hypothetical protein